MENYEVKSMIELATCGICLQIFSDARVLPRCRHTFCLQCLRDLQMSSQPTSCPKCREDTVPGGQSLDDLESNKIIHDTITLLVQQGYVNDDDFLDTGAGDRHRHSHLPHNRSRRPQRPALSPQRQQEPQLRRQRQQERSQLRLLRPPRPSQPSRTLRQHQQQDDLPSGAQYPQPPQPPPSRPPPPQVRPSRLPLTQSRLLHVGVTCGYCGCSNISGSRYICGICNDFNLCEECVEKPREQVHDENHVFIKLKRPQEIPTPKSNALTKEGLKLGESMEYGKFFHKLKIFFFGSRDVSCKGCGVKPIAGTRYMCGMCKGYDLCKQCEGKADTFHPKDHAFLVIRHPTQYQPRQPLLRFRFYKRIIFSNR